MRLTKQLLTVAQAYCDASEVSLARVSTIIFRDGKKFRLMEAGADLTTGNFEAAMAWFSANWPADAEWPAGIARPAVTEAAGGGR